MNQRVILSEAKDPLPRGVPASLEGILRFAQDDTLDKLQRQMEADT